MANFTPTAEQSWWFDYECLELHNENTEAKDKDYWLKYYAGQALSGLLSSPQLNPKPSYELVKEAKFYAEELVNLMFEE